MGISHSGTELAGKVEKFATSIPNANKKALEAAALTFKATVSAEEAKASGGDLILGRVNNGKGARIGVNYKVSGSTAVVKATGPVQLVENRIHEHVIGPRGVGVQKGHRKSRAGRTKAVDAGAAIYGVHDVLKVGEGFARWVSHPGVAVGKHPWAKGVAAATPKTMPEFAKTYHAALLGAFR